MVFLLYGLAMFGLLTSTVFAGLVLAGARHHLRQSIVADGRFAPAMSLLKPLHGSEPGLEANLTSFFQQDYSASQFEIIFCACEEGDDGLAVARGVAGRYPQVRSRFLFTNGEPPHINAKVASLELMTAAAAYPILVISDSDVRVSSEYLDAVAQPFSESAVGAMTCLYRGVAAEGRFWARVEAVGMSVEMTAGVLVANLLEGMRFVLGPTMAVRRDCITAMGGMGILGDFCSDDYLLGNYVYQQDRTVILSRHVIDHMVINARFVDSMKHQIRWMKSTRFSRPKGHFGTALTFSMPFALLALATGILNGKPMIGVSLFVWGLLTRWAIAWAAGSRVVEDRNWANLYMLYPFRDLLGFGFWAASYLSNKIVWRGKVYRLLTGGRMIVVD